MGPVSGRGTAEPAGEVEKRREACNVRSGDGEEDSQGDDSGEDPALVAPVAAKARAKAREEDGVLEEATASRSRGAEVRQSALLKAMLVRRRSKAEVWNQDHKPLIRAIESNTWARSRWARLALPLLSNPLAVRTFINGAGPTA